MTTTFKLYVVDAWGDTRGIDFETYSEACDAYHVLEGKSARSIAIYEVNGGAVADMPIIAMRRARISAHRIVCSNKLTEC